MLLRRKTADDVGPLEALARRTHVSDRYPRFLIGDVAAFMTPPGETHAWVADDDGVLAGHVALHGGEGDEVGDVAAAALGIEPADVSLLIRLVVSPDHRRLGLGRSLVETACAAARSEGLTPVLDVIADAAGPIALYESLGWQQISRFDFVIDDAHRLDLLVYVAPALA